MHQKPFRVPDDIQGEEELETKILNIDVDAVRKALRKLHAKSDGEMSVTEQRYETTKNMKKHKLSTRLRKLENHTRTSVELVLKKKHPREEIEGHEELGPRLKRRTEFELDLQNTTSSECRYSLMRTLMLAYGLKERDRITTARTQFILTGKLKGVHVDIERILSYKATKGRERKTNLPPPFLEIEGPTPAKIISTAKALGYDVEDLSPLTKRALIKKHARKRRKGK